MNNEPKIGQLIQDGDTAQRDAIHVAIVPLTAGEDLHKGERFRLSQTSNEIAFSGEYRTSRTDRTAYCGAVGIVDPFLNKWTIHKGESFYGFLFPGTVTGMRHHWRHPVFDAEKNPMSEDEKWLREFCDRWNFDWTELISEASMSYANEPEGGYIVARGHDLSEQADFPDGELDEFWDRLENFTEKKFSDEHKNKVVWTCSC